MKTTKGGEKEKKERKIGIPCLINACLSVLVMPPSLFRFLCQRNHITQFILSHYTPGHRLPPHSRFQTQHKRTNPELINKAVSVSRCPHASTSLSPSLLFFFHHSHVTCKLFILLSNIIRKMPPSVRFIICLNSQVFIFFKIVRTTNIKITFHTYARYILKWQSYSFP